MLHKEAGDYSKAADLIEQASTLYLEHGTQDTAAVVLDRAGKWAAFVVQFLSSPKIFIDFSELNLPAHHSIDQGCSELFGEGFSASLVG